ncbi:uncharacterized protein DDB_G0283357 [Uranotaenia lowii]|uniref:uncharacterized protein DDB_G0283357 n=1 Tax=Uranotaenia lowii TaxID=190385 RepID=UPI0024788124|nr:uncharacterized protein DDB_G0283357 [Uranotaenia lowii]
MWEMLDSDLECGGNECGGPGPPPEFRIPPPPRPPFLAELANCNEDGPGSGLIGGPVAALMGPGGAFPTAADGGDMCDAIPILDTSYHNSPSFQTSLMIVLCSVLLLLVIFISSLLVWKHKRKVQNFLPCKTPTRGGPPHHLDATGVVSGAHSVTYEDPDVHLGHHPLVMRHHHHHHHHNMELHHPKQIHYPSGYPMPRSPPLFICSSPGPDPYRSHDNVYEELEHPRDTDSEPPVQSDDDFAEDELSLPGERSFHKSSSDGGVGVGAGGGSTTVATIYHDRSAASSNGTGTNSGSNTDPYMERNRTERNSLLSSSSSGNDNNLRQVAGGAAGSSSSSGITNSSGGNNNNNNNTNRNSNSSSECASSASGNNNSGNNAAAGTNNSAGGMFRSRKQQAATLGSGRGGNKHLTTSSNSTCSPTEASSNAAMAMMAMPYDERAMMTLPPSYQTAAAAGPTTAGSNHLNSLNNNSFVNSNSLNNNNNNSTRSNYYSTIEDDCDPVERRNRINTQLSASAASMNGVGTPPGVSTIFRNGRPPYNNNGVGHHNHHNHHTSNRSRTNPRSLDRRRYIQSNNVNNNNGGPASNLAVISSQDPSQYIYHEPVFHEGLIYDACLSYSDRSSGSGSAGPAYPYILPQFTTFRNHSGGNGVGPTGHPQAIYSRDSSFGSDSGYSQHTQASNRSTGWCRPRLLTPQQQKSTPTQQLQALQQHQQPQSLGDAQTAGTDS